MTTFIFSTFLAMATAQTPGDKMIEAYLAKQVDKLNQNFLQGAKSIDDWKKLRPRLHQEYMDMLGLWPIPEKTSLKATVTGQVEAHGVVVEKVHYQSKPGLYVTGNLYRPKDDTGAKRKRLPAILYVCGHSGKGRDGNKSAFQDHGFWFANNGYVCLVVDTLQLGEIPGVHHGTYGRPWLHLKSWLTSKELADANKFDVNEGVRWWWHSAGYSPAAVECWNGVRGIDYLVSRPDVDPERIGVTGISGGGAATFWVACADERVKVAVPVSGMSDLESYVKNKVVNGHCDCMFLDNVYQWDWTTIAALFAPRPMLFANSDNDRIFPMDGNRRIMVKLRQLYKMYDKADLVEEYVSGGGHDYRPDLRIAIFKFLNKHLKDDVQTPVEDAAKYTPLPGKDLRVFATDADLPKDRINERVDETFVARGKPGVPEEGKFEEWKGKLLKELRERCFRNVDAWQTNHGPIPAGKEEKREITLEDEKTWRPVFVTEPGIEAVGYPVLMRGKIKTLYVDSGTAMANKSLNKLPQKGNAWVLWPRGNEFQPESNWSGGKPPHYVERSHVLLGRTVDEGRVWDILAAVAHIRERDKDAGFTLAGDGPVGILAAYAALLEGPVKSSAIHEVVVIDPPKSHKEGPHLLGVLRVLDIPEALGLLAPRRLTIIGGKDAAFDRTEEIYRRAGAAGRLVRK